MTQRDANVTALFSLWTPAVSSASFLHDPSHWNSFIQADLPQSNHLSSRCAPLFSDISHLFCANPSPIRRSGQGSFLTIQIHTLPLWFIVMLPMGKFRWITMTTLKLSYKSEIISYFNTLEIAFKKNNPERSYIRRKA